MAFLVFLLFFFFFNDTATTEIYTLSLHDALPISPAAPWPGHPPARASRWCWKDRKSTRLNSSHSQISYAVFCLKKKKKKEMYLYISRKLKKRRSIKSLYMNI